MSIRIALVDDQFLIREGIGKLLQLNGDVTLVAQGSDGNDAIHILNNEKPDVLLLDLSMPHKDGISVLKQSQVSGNSIPILVLTTFDDPNLVIQCIQFGAKGYLLKDVALETLIDAIKHVHGGDTFFQPCISETLLEQHRSMPKVFEEHHLDTELSVKEQEVLRLVAAGCTNKDIAQALCKSEGTIKNHMSNVLTKLGVQDRTRAVLLAIEKGILK